MARSTISNNPNYFEAIIQLRPYDDKIYDFIEKELGTKRAHGVFISRIEELKTGIDIYLSSQKFARSIGDQLRKHFKGWKLLVTKKMCTSDRLTSRDLYRATVLFRKEKENVSED